MLLVEDDFPLGIEEHSYANRIKIKSWSGVLDKDIECETEDSILIHDGDTFSSTSAPHVETSGLA